MSLHDSIFCHRCAAELVAGRGNFYVVRIEAFADPSPPRLDDADTAPGHWEALIDQVRESSERELMDQVHRRLTIHLCRTCYRRWIEDPAG